MPRLLAILLLLGGLAGLVLAGREVVWQDRVARVYVPVWAQVVSSQVPELQQNKRTAYLPEVRYHYGVGAQSYESTRIWPYWQSVDAARARAMLKEFAPQARVMAFVDPAAPGQAVLLRECSSLPYWLTATALAALWAGGGALTGMVGPRRNDMVEGPCDQPGWRLLLPKCTLKERQTQAGVLLLTTGLPMAALARHLGMIAHPMPTWGWAFALTAGVVVITEAARLWQTWNAGRAMSDARLMVVELPARRGAPLSLRAEISAHQPLEFNELRARVVCAECYLFIQGRRTQLATRVIREETIPLLEHMEVPAGRRVAGAGEVFLDPEQWHPSGRRGLSTYPFIKWEVHVEMTGSRHYAGVFPLTVV